jgi:hypothetical protein
MNFDWLVKTGRVYTTEEVDHCPQRQLELSRQLTRLIDVLYALVLVQGAVNYRALFTIGNEFSHPSQFLPVLLALILIYFTTIQSFIDYHFASEDQPYQLLNKDNRRNDLARFYLDVLIVGAYSFLLLKCHVLLAVPGADLTPVFVTYVAIFGLYLVWGWLRKSTADPKEQRYSPWLLGLVLIVYGGLWAGYTRFSPDWIVNAAFLSGALLVMLVYRRVNWLQTSSCSPESLGVKSVSSNPAPAPSVPQSSKD